MSSNTSSGTSGGGELPESVGGAVQQAPTPPHSNGERPHSGSRPVGIATGVSAEGRFLDSIGKPVHRHINELADKRADAKARARHADRSAELAEVEASARVQHHRGGRGPFLLRVAIPVAFVAEAATAYVGVAAMVSDPLLGIGISATTAACGGALAMVAANRRLDHLPVPVWVRLLEVGLVVALTGLRAYTLLHSPGADLLGAVGGSLLVGCISAASLGVIEELVVETHNFPVFMGKQLARLKRAQSARAWKRVGRLQARLGAAVAKTRRLFFDFLLRTEEGVAPEEAQRRADALARALTEGDE